MSAKNKDAYQRWRCITVGFRMSEEESDQLNRLVAISGLTKQDYIINRLLEREVIVVGNALELERLHTVDDISPELQNMITTVATVFDRMREK